MTSRGTQYWSSGAIPLIGPDILGDIIANASDIAVVISDMGRVLSVLINPNHASFGQLDHWQGRDIRDFLTIESVAKLDTQLEVFNTGKSSTKAIELNHTDGTVWEFPVRYSFHRVGPDGGLLLLGRDLRPIAEMQQQLVKAQLALERDYEAQRDSETRLRVVMDETREALAFVSLGTGRIVDLNAAAAMVLGENLSDLKDTPLANEFENRKRGELLDALVAAALAEDHPPVPLTSRRTGRALRVSPRIFRASGDRMLLCRFENAESAQNGADPLRENLGAFYRDGVDAILFTDRNGVIQSGNEAFLKLIGAAHLSIVKGKPLSDFLARGSVDMKLLVENAARAGQMRLFASRLINDFGVEVPVEISATWLQSSTHPAVVLVMRDAGHAEALRGPGVAIGDQTARPVMDLVGTATLKDIVSETTDVVEKMCIETAVELTRNNRVAAAEMLGLSRQSLYVKLRKYGLLSRDS
ncbi:transcriptional regulator PpsR [Oceaniglobus roseus]|uniref:transcriptional regulator PpsR n=1 Tax=Oceaniglobus roseus TaxID=1737570 RepID=UPI000C7EFC01|nr:transcriptional regulator PpsR [Kandeliimicrobium roseum]